MGAVWNPGSGVYDDFAPGKLLAASVDDLKLRDVHVEIHKSEKKVSTILIVGVCRTVPEFKLLSVVRASFHDVVDNLIGIVREEHIDGLVVRTVWHNALDSKGTT